MISSGETPQPRAGVSIAPERKSRTGNTPAPRADRYREDIDGLRAVAIVLVVVTHMGVRNLTGGFIGVDIFFVISGYLLTGNIAHNIAKGDFLITAFYERRIRRIVPALIAMLAITSVGAYLVLPSQALVLYSQSLLAALFSYSNFYFAAQPDGYFAPTFIKLLLHTWSLGVEEQFYLVLPVCMLWAATRPRDATRRIVVVLGVASFASALYLTYADRVLGFYMPFTRAWELLVGSGLALRMLPSPTSRSLRELMAGLSILLFIVCLFAYTASTPFPGLAAIPPCAATAMLILVGERGRTTVSSFLSWRPMVFVGMISYSLYLWHWPVIMFLRLGIVPEYRAIHALAILKIVVSIALAVLSWQFVEQPFRTGRWKSMPRARVFRTAGLCAAALTVVAVTTIAAKGLPERFPAGADTVGNYLFHDSSRRGASCFVETNFAGFDPRVCLALSHGKANALLLGDSHANSLWFGLSQSLPMANVLQATASSCPAVEGSYDRSACGSLRRFIYMSYLPTHHVDTVILTQAWRSLADYEALEPTLDWFLNRHIPVIVIGPVPEYTAALPLLLEFSIAWHRPALPEHRLLRSMGALDRQLRAQVLRRSGVRYASVWEAVCPADRCQEYADKDKHVPMFLDGNHLGDEGASLAVRRMQAAGELPL